MPSREGLCCLVFGHANATTWIANAMAGGAMQGPAPTMSYRLDNCTHESHRENILDLLPHRLGPTTHV